MPGVRRADREVEEVVDAGGGEHLELRLRVLGRDPGGADRLVVGERDADREALADLGPDRPANLEREPAAFLDAAAVRVVAAVVERAQELADEPAVRAVHLDAVEPACPDVPGRAGEVGGDLGQIGLAERQRRLAAGRRYARRGPDWSPALEPDGALSLRTGGDELGEEAGLEGSELRSERGEALDLPLVVGRQRAREGSVAERRRGQLLAEEQSDSAEGPLPVEGEVAVGDQAVLAVLERRRRAHHPVGKRHAADRQRLPERLEDRVPGQGSNVSHRACRRPSDRAAQAPGHHGSSDTFEAVGSRVCCLRYSRLL